MKCLCGYYHMSDWEIERESEVFQEELKTNNGYDKFINIKGTFLQEKDYGRVQEVSIYACPKCGTLKI